MAHWKDGFRPDVQQNRRRLLVCKRPFTWFIYLLPAGIRGSGESEDGQSVENCAAPRYEQQPDEADDWYKELSMVHRVVNHLWLPGTTRQKPALFRLFCFRSANFPCTGWVAGNWVSGWELSTGCSGLVVTTGRVT